MRPRIFAPVAVLIVLTSTAATQAEYLVPVANLALPPGTPGGPFPIAAQNLASDGVNLFVHGLDSTGPWMILKMDPDSGALIDTLGPYTRSDGITWHGGSLYLGETVGDWPGTTLAGVWRVDPGSGAILGSLPSPDLASRRFDLTSDGVNLYALTTDFGGPHRLLTLDPATFDVLGAIDISPFGVMTGPAQGLAYFDSHLYVSTNVGLSKYSLTGDLLATYRLPGFDGVELDVFGGPVFIGGRLFINTRDGYIREFAFSDVPYVPPSGIIPEPGSVVMGLMGLVGVMLMMRARPSIVRRTPRNPPGC